MLVNFRVANFLSFKELQEFSMIAGNADNLTNHIISDTIDVLDRAVIFGPNSAGKTNFINAMAYAQAIVNGDDMECSHTFKLFENMSYKGKGSRKPLSYFEFQIMLDGKLYSYGFEYNTLVKSFASEWLLELKQDGSERTIFKFVQGDYSSIIIDNEDDADAIRNHESIDGPFLNVSSSQESEKIRLWISNSLRIVMTLGDNKLSEKVTCWLNKDDFVFFMNELKRLDTGITGMVSNDMWGNVALDKLCKGITHLNAEDVDPIEVEGWDPIDNRYAIYVNGDYCKYKIPSRGTKVSFGSSSMNINVDRMVDEDYIEGEGQYWSIPFTEEDLGETVTDTINVSFTHHPSHFTIPVQDESEGTKKIIQILLLLMAKRENCKYIDDNFTLVYDEFECSIHELIVKELLNIYTRIRRDRHLQMIITTHESRLLDKEILRADEIWFVNSSEDDGSSIYSLYSFVDDGSGRYDVDYLHGRYGAIPNTCDDIYPHGDDY